MNKCFSYAAAALLAITALCGCKNGNDRASGLPENFATIGDAGRVQYVASRVAPDSLARFIIYGALGRNPGAPIDSIAIATNFAYERLKGDDLDKFSGEYDAVVEGLPLGDKMKIYKLGGSEDPQGLGYRLGLEYMTSIRDGNKSVADIERELKEFKKVCGQDTAMYRRFLIGFRTVLEVDRGTDVSEEIYNKFVNYEKVL